MIIVGLFTTEATSRSRTLRFWAISPVRWHFQEEIPEKIRKDPANALRAFPGIPLRVRLGSPKPYNSRQLRLPEHFQNSLPPVRLGRLFFQKWFERGPLRAVVPDFPAALRARTLRFRSSSEWRNTHVFGNDS